MVRKACDNCNKIIQVGDELGGQKVACEACGDINLMPDAPDPSRASRTDALGLPPDHGPEQAVLLVRPAMVRARPLVFFAHLVALVAGLAGVVFGLLTSAAGFPIVAAVAGGLVALVAVGSLGVWKIKTLSAALEITNKRTVHRKGLLSKATSEVVHDNIRNVQVTQSFWERIWRVGTLGLSSSGQDGIEIEIADIPDPERVRKIIDAYRPLG
ncbi:MAG: PH domain-containing protein [Phycisphaerales bacterium]|nr:PH domain-containing protein [Phycisphaerales bacterium]